MIGRNTLSQLTFFLVATAGMVVLFCNYLVFFVVPNERIMGAVQRIFYFHVGSATACYAAVGVLCFASLYYLATTDRRSDLLAVAAAEVAFLFASIVLASGMIWGHSAWNTWFSWEPRLVSFLVLWLSLLSYIVLRNVSDSPQVATHASVIAILSAINVPIVIYSIKLLPTISQLHPQVVEKQGLRHPSFTTTMFYCLAALVILQALLIILRYRLGVLEESTEFKLKKGL